MKTLIISIVTLVTTLSAVAQSQHNWTSVDGRTITAGFVQLDGETLTIRKGDKDFKLPLSKLAPESQGRARFMEEELTKWAEANFQNPIISEKGLEWLIRHAPEMAEGRHYIIEGVVKSVAQGGSSLRKTRPIEVKLAGGTPVPLNYEVLYPGKRYRFNVDGDRLIVLRGQLIGFKDNSYKNFIPYKTLITSGQKIEVVVNVRKGEIVGVGRASSKDVLAARVEMAKLSGSSGLNEFLAAEELKNRITFLRAALKTGVKSSSSIRGQSINLDSGDISQSSGRVVTRYTPDEMAAMRTELALLEAKLGG